MLPLKLKYDKAYFNEDLLFIGLIFHKKTLFKKNFCWGFLYLFLSGIIEFDQNVIIDLNYAKRENLNKDRKGSIFSTGSQGGDFTVLRRSSFG